MRSDENLDKALITALTSRRIASGMTQDELAIAVTELRIGLSWNRSHVAAVESGRRRGLRAAEIIALCVVHGVTIADLLLQVGVDERYIAALQGQTESEVVLTENLGALTRRVEVARTALDPAAPVPDGGP